MRKLSRPLRLSSVFDRRVTRPIGLKASESGLFSSERGPLAFLGWVPLLVLYPVRRVLFIFDYSLLLTYEIREALAFAGGKAKHTFIPPVGSNAVICADIQWDDDWTIVASWLPKSVKGI